MDETLCVFGFFSLSLLIAGLIILFTLLKKIAALGGWQGLKRAAERARQEHPSRFYPLRMQAGRPGTLLIGGAAIILLGLLAGGGGGLAFLSNLDRANLLKDEGVVVLATVVDKTIDEDSEGDDDYYISYSFLPRAEDGTVQNEIAIREEVSRSLYTNWSREEKSRSSTPAATRRLPGSQPNTRRAQSICGPCSWVAAGASCACWGFCGFSGATKMLFA
jgi:hypothetical protein